jgi:hypothetical protein
LITVQQPLKIILPSSVAQDLYSNTSEICESVHGSDEITMLPLDSFSAFSSFAMTTDDASNSSIAVILLNMIIPFLLEHIWLQYHFCFLRLQLLLPNNLQTGDKILILVQRPETILLQTTRIQT